MKACVWYFMLCEYSLYVCILYICIVLSLIYGNISRCYTVRNGSVRRHKFKIFIKFDLYFLLLYVQQAAAATYSYECVFRVSVEKQEHKNIWEKWEKLVCAWWTCIIYPSLAIHLDSILPLRRCYSTQNCWLHFSSSQSIFKFHFFLLSLLFYIFLLFRAL